jgi:hypothetical protein
MRMRRGALSDQVPIPTSIRALSPTREGRRGQVSPLVPPEADTGGARRIG